MSFLLSVQYFLLFLKYFHLMMSLKQSLHLIFKLYINYFTFGSCELWECWLSSSFSALFLYIIKMMYYSFQDFIIFDLSWVSRKSFQRFIIITFHFRKISYYLLQDFLLMKVKLSNRTKIVPSIVLFIFVIMEGKQFIIFYFVFLKASINFFLSSNSI